MGGVGKEKIFIKIVLVTTNRVTVVNESTPVNDSLERQAL